MSCNFIKPLLNSVIFLNPIKKIVLPYLGMLFICLAESVCAQVNISGGNTVTENFDGMGASATASLPTGWRAKKETVVRTVGTYASAGIVTEQADGASMPTNAENGIYNFGAGATDNGPDRAVGGLSSGGGSQSVNLYVDLLNSGTKTISGFSISYDVEKYRQGSNTAGFRIQMYYSIDGNSWTSAGTNFLTAFPADASNSGYATAPGATVSVTAQPLSVNIAAGSHLYLAWNYSVTSGSTTSTAQALGIDNVNITVSSEIPLPLNLLSFTGKFINCNTLLEWKTANEVNTKSFDIEYSRDGVQFSFLQKVNAKGSGDNAYFVQLPQSGKTIHYRLAMVDRDNTKSYSKTIIVRSNCDVNGYFSVYPNPADKNVPVILQSSLEELVSYKVLDVSGKLLRKGNFQTRAELNNLGAGGTYFVELQSASQSKKFKIVVQ